MKIPPEPLRRLTQRIFLAAGCHERESTCLAEHLVEANLAGHDSHGVIRIPNYVQWVREGKVVPNQSLRVRVDREVLAVVDGQAGFGQSVAAQAVEMGAAKARAAGMSAVALCNAGHLGRIGHWAEMAARAGLLSLHFVNTTGKGLLVAPFGGIERRLSANPLAAGVPVEGGDPIILDISTCMIAEGKVRVALNRGATVPDGCLIDSRGRPTNEPRAFYADPPGAILPFGGHKGYGLGVIVEMLAGALAGGGCTDPRHQDQLLSGMLSVYFDPAAFGEPGAFHAEVARFSEWVKSARTVAPDGEVLLPGELENRHRAARRRDGIELDEATWNQLTEVCGGLGVPPELG